MVNQTIQIVLKSGTEYTQEVSDDAMSLLVDEIHRVECHLLHDEQCFWFSRTPDKKRMTVSYSLYLDKAQAILKIVDYATAMRILGML